MEITIDEEVVLVALVVLVAPELVEELNDHSIIIKIIDHHLLRCMVRRCFFHELNIPNHRKVFKLTELCLYCKS